MKRNSNIRRFIFLAFIVFILNICLALEAKELDFSGCVVVTPKKLGKVEQRTVQVLQEEIYKRTQIQVSVTNEWPSDGKPVIALGLASKGKKFAEPFKSDLKHRIPKIGNEGYSLFVKNSPRLAAVIIAKDARGLLFGVGGFLRKISLTEKSILVPQELSITTTPQYPIRGHQLGYRPKTNAYDAWTVEQYDQYIRELALFGSNCIEIMPLITDDQFKNDLMKYEPLDMNIKLTEIIDSYGMDVWMWYPNMGDTKDFTEEKLMAKQLAERDEVSPGLTGLLRFCINIIRKLKYG
ncbi:MAG: hypothetical protein ACYS6K_25765 [Planctomycetota bacterium]|jgi:alpha-glucuronidase